MKKCAKCGKVSEDGKVWIFQKEIMEVKSIEILYCPICKIKIDLDFFNILFWRKNNEIY